ncbi:MAG: glutathione S-transferase family protein [Drouetiella hepatica Uher 2000/2452]|jgi:glutathione S-transferase|uniref:glutathione transferase n=1 Tax=Drouetiella hepatica Uher 2000/2452 TaxID=904376 RepID=A0A951QGU3_9CYAN|nr:glutathione S-transferase family protein [Drouetiella hepatica Uher 2000/2452]
MSELILYGFPVSPYVRSARIALIEKGADYHYNEIGLDHLATDEYVRLNPFRKMPVLQQENFVLYETPAILGYIDEAFDGASLQPADPKARAQMRKWIGISSSYLYPVGVMQLFLQRIMFPIMGNEPDETLVEHSANAIAQYLDVIEQELVDTFLIGNALSLADIITGAMIDYVNMTKEGSALIHARPKTAAWLSHLSQRESFKQSLAGLLEGKKQR